MRAWLWRLGLFSAWAVCFLPVLRWLFATFTGEAFRLNLALLTAVLVMLLLGRRSRASTCSQSPLPRRLPLSLLAASTLLYALAERALDIHILSAALFGLATYALVGLFASPAAWRRALVPALLLIAVLPFGEQANTYAGFAARLVTARVVEGALSFSHVASVSADTVMMFESGVAYVDVPCSGIKSLWTGLVFFLAATHIERRTIDLRWLTAALIFAALLFAANVTRVLVIVLLVARGEHQAAELLHEPLGLFTFAVACAVGFGLLARLALRARSARSARENIDAAEPVSPAAADIPPAGKYFTPVLCAAFLLAGFAANNPENSLPATPHLALDFPATLHTELSPLTESEAGLFRRAGSTFAEKREFADAASGLSGTVLVVYTTNWRAHHPPELCLAGSGIRVDKLETISFSPDRRLRTASIDGGLRTAIYWYQSPARTTGDLLDRVLDDVTGGEQRWVLVSIMLDRPADAATIETAYELFSRTVLAATKEKS